MAQTPAPPSSAFSHTLNGGEAGRLLACCLWPGWSDRSARHVRMMLCMFVLRIAPAHEGAGGRCGEVFLVQREMSIHPEKQGEKKEGMEACWKCSKRNTEYSVLCPCYLLFFFFLIGDWMFWSHWIRNSGREEPSRRFKVLLCSIVENQGFSRGFARAETHFIH